ncbi:acetyltransferase (isoleucine patch superfamily) [Rivularia sp. PCC 7116]|uniref:acyltransferase n=1 Tax=Rivularia sp. PCC 7116 TaxID=373994 RepID=UPI00029ED6FF|nr:acyltransferase [Rivularia sp. PCC 7116]AFY55940.1 acetyltransferase (isoleucine patch superfamily) [Rivularia sp. PCC 7116]
MTTAQFDVDWKSYSRPPTNTSRILEIIAFSLAGWIPHPVGSLLRKLIYPLTLARMGKKVSIFQGVELIGAGGIEIGDHVKILRNTRLEIKDANSFIFLDNRVCIDCGVDIRTAGSDCWIEIGENSYLGPYVCMAGPGNIKIGRDCQIASHSSLYANNHRDYGLSREGIHIEDKCWIGTGVRILDGVTIGRGSVIGAGSVVTKNIPPGSIAVGVPAKVIKLSKNGAA